MDPSSSRIGGHEDWEKRVDEDDDDDALFEQLEEELDQGNDAAGFMSSYRERRLEELKREQERVRMMKEDDHGKLVDMKVEKEIIQATLYARASPSFSTFTQASQAQGYEIVRGDLLILSGNVQHSKNKRTVIHFYHPDFRRCKLMDGHLETLAARHFHTKFIKADVANVPFLVVKLEIKVLPCVISFVDGISRDKIVGFETIGDGTSDNFTTSQLELRLSQAGVIDAAAFRRQQQDGAIQRPSFA